MSTSGEQSYEERQRNEFIAITGIFPNEVEDLRKKFSGSKWIPLELNITVYPEESMTADKGSNSYVHLYIRCSATYPSSPPFIDIREAKGISNQNMNLLKTQLISKARELEGREVIFELIHHSQSFLYDHKAPHYGSFFDEMVFNESKKLQEMAEQLKQQQLQQKLLENQKILAIEQEKARKMEALRGANRRARFADCDDVLLVAPLERARKSSMSRQRSRSTSTGKGAGCSSDNLLQECKDMVNCKLKFSGKKEITVICGRCLGHSDRGCVTYSAIDMATGNLGAVIKWTFYFSPNHKLKGQEWETLQKEQGVYLKQLASIEQEFKTLRQLNHKHLVHYLGMNCVTKKERIVVYVLQEFIAGCTLSTIENDFHLTIPQLQHCVRDILDALKYLHDNSIVHKNLRSSSLFVDTTGVVKMTDYSLDKKLYDLLRTLTKEEEIDFYPPTIGKGGKKSDIYRLGILLLSLNASPLNSVPIIVPDDLNPTFKDFLNKCLIHDEQERWSADQLLSHSFLASTSAVAVFPKEEDLKDEENNGDSQNALLDCDGIRGSRLYLEFDVLKELGKGGFGRVWKVKNKLDSRMYALKRIPLNPSNVQLNRKIKREVKLLSRLNHENIVRYYNSWIEATPEAETCTQNGDVQDSETKEKTESSIRWKIGDKDFSDEDDEDDDFIVFMSEGLKNKENTTSGKNSSTEPEAVSSNDEQSVPRMRQYMYIQMQFCEKSTLRIAIDNGLHQSKSLVWRLFREIVEGLHYIHQQGVIHRDLKPVNIFLDSNDHVKIGDFGLATDVTPKLLAADIPFVDQDPQSRSDIDDGQQTGRVGTAFYVAPELASSGKVSYSQKVDIYSLGIIFFEMCYPPPTTLMERNIIISNLRQRDTVFPNEATENLDEAMLSIIKWLLQHDVTKRPNSNELIASEAIPPLLMEETELNNLLHTTISNPQSRMYKHMISSLFEQEVSTEFDHTYEIDVYGLSYKYKPSRIFSNVMDVLSRIMRLHAASYLSIPTLMPKTSVIETEQWVQIMEHGGGIVMLPHNSRIPFARYIARRETDYMKRYSIEKVYRQQKVYGCHPREQYEFVFDIVTPTTSSFIPDAEIISAMSEIVSEFPSLENRNYCIRLNHVNLLKAIILYSELEDVEQELLYLAGERKDKVLTKSMLMDERNNLNLNEKSIGRLGQFIELEEDNVDRLTHLLHPVLHKKGKICNLARSSLKDLENIIKLVKSFGVKLPVVICPGLTHYISLYSGMFFQCICTLKTSKRKNVYDILSAGGRYDKLIQSFKLSDTTCTRIINQFAVGVSISIESIISAEFEANESQDMSAADFLIHSEGSNLACEKVNLMKELQDLGIRATILYDKNMTLDDAAVYCANRDIQHMLILLECEPGIIKVRSLDKERVTNDRRVITSEIKDVLPKLCSKLTAETKAMEYVRSPVFTNTCVSIDVRYLAPDKVHNIKKREPNIRTHVGTVLQSFPSRTLAVIPVDLKMQIIGTIIARCDVSASVDAIQRSFDSIIDEFAKHKKYLSLLCDEICEVRSKKPTDAVILYSLPESNFRVIL